MTKKEEKFQVGHPRIINLQHCDGIRNHDNNRTMNDNDNFRLVRSKYL